MSIAYALVLGLWGTTILHVAKGMQNKGIKEKRKSLYLIALLIDASSIIWLTISNIYGPPSYYTGMYGFGLIALMGYTKYAMHEKISKYEYSSALILIIGTALIGVGGILVEQPNYSTINEDQVVKFSILFASGGVVVCFLISRKNDVTLIGIVFGFVAGGIAALEPVMRAVGQTKGGTARIFPSVPEGWPIFILSFAGGLFGLIITQWAFVKKAKASMTIPTFNSTYIILPNAIQLIALEGYYLSTLMIAGMVIVVVGIVLYNMALLKKEVGIDFSKNNPQDPE